MKSNQFTMTTAERFKRLTVAILAVASFLPGRAQSGGDSASSPWSFSASLSAKETFDSNVYLQELGPDADKESFVTTIIPSVGVAYKGTHALGITLSYAPEINRFHSESSESFVLHRAGLNFSGKANQTTWELVNGLIVIDGDDEGLIYVAPGDVPAAGGPAIRDRRDAIIYRGGFKLTHSFERWFIRPAVSAYVHDFRTAQKTTPGYLNFVDRSDFNGGADAGFDIGKNTYVVAGYRYGAQDQDQLFPEINPARYDNSYHRALFGVEGKPRSWLKLAVSLGPEFRTYGDDVPANFSQKHRTYLYVDSVITLTPSKADTITLSAKRFEQPGFGGRSTYDDCTYSVNWLRKLTDKLTVGLGGRAYQTHFLKPAVRNDWIYTGNVLASYAFTKQFSGEISYAYDDARSEISSKPGREYTRHVGAIGLKYVFK